MATARRVRFFHLFFICNFVLTSRAINCPKVCQCNQFYERGISLRCRSKSMIEYLKVLPKKTLDLYIIDDTVEEIEQDILKDLPHVVELSIGGRQIKRIHSLAFQNATGLQSLYIMSTQISRINDKHFSSLVNLKTLFLRLNQIETIHEKAFHSLSNLYFLDLSKNRLHVISKDLLLPLTGLKYLLIADNNISHIDSGFLLNQKKLLRFSASNNKIQTISENVFANLTNLKQLFLNGNKMTTLNNVLLPLTNLQVLDLQNNKIKIINNISLSTLTKLKTLNLGNNGLKSIHKNVFKLLPSLKSINISNNHLTKVIFFQNLKLNFLDIGYNNFCRIFLPFELISTLRLPGNPCIFKTFKNLNKKEDGKADNNSYTLSSNIFTLRNLYHLDISKNDIQFLPPNLFDNLEELSSLRISSNPLTTLDKNLIHNLVNLPLLNSIEIQGIDLNFHLFDIYEFEKSNGKVQVDARQNALHCSCYLLKLMKKTKHVKTDCVLENEIVDPKKLTCENITGKWQKQQVLPKDSDATEIKLFNLKYLDRPYIIEFNFKIITSYDVKSLNLQPSTKNISIQISISNLKAIVISFPAFHLYKRSSISISQKRISERLRFEINVNGWLIYSKERYSVKYTTQTLHLIRIKILSPNFIFDVKRNITIYKQDCTINNGGCSDRCTIDNKTGIGSCSCFPGQSSIDNKTCNYDKHMYVLNQQSIIQLLDVKMVSSVPVNSSGALMAATHDYLKRSFYYVERRENESHIMSMNVVSGKYKVLKIIPYFVNKISFDDVNRILYYTSKEGIIGRFKVSSKFLDGTEIIARLQKPMDIVLDSTLNKLFVTDQALYQVLSYDLRGSRMRVISSDLYGINGLTIDKNNKKLYWGDSYSNVIEEVNYNGECRRTILWETDITTKASLTFFNGHLYWLKEGSDHSIIYKTDISKGTSLVDRVIPRKAIQICVYNKQMSLGTEALKVTCKKNNRFKNPIFSKKSYLYNINQSETRILKHGHSISEEIKLSQGINLFGMTVNEIYVSPKGSILIEPTSYMSFYQKDRFSLAVYASNTTNRFFGDVFVTETKNKHFCAKVQNDIKDKMSISLIPLHLIIITWSNVSNILKSNEQNTFQAVIASGENKTFVMYNYEHLGVPQGSVAYITQNCSVEQKIVAGERLSHSRHILMIPRLCTIKENFFSETFEFLEKVSTPFIFIAIVALVVIVCFSCGRKNAMNEQENYKVENNAESSDNVRP